MKTKSAWTESREIADRWGKKMESFFGKVLEAAAEIYYLNKDYWEVRQIKKVINANIEEASHFKTLKFMDLRNVTHTIAVTSCVVFTTTSSGRYIITIWRETYSMHFDVSREAWHRAQEEYFSTAFAC